MIQKLIKWLERMQRYYHHLNRRRKLAFWFVWLMIGVVAFPYALSLPLSIGPGDASFVLTTSEPTVGIDQTFKIELQVKSPRRAINTVGAVLVFDPSRLEVIKMSTEQSFCSFYADNGFDNIKGEVRLGCGTPNPGFSGDSTLLTLTMRSKSIGLTSLGVSDRDAYILANDGKGTNLLGQRPSISISVQQRF